MNINEFAALQVGDRVENPMSKSAGEVTEVIKRSGAFAGVRVRWGDGTPRHDVSFTYTVDMTTWFHWSKVEPEA